MELTAREAARLLNISQEVLYQWMRDKGLPAHRVNEQYRFNHAQLLEWATAEGVPLSAQSFRMGHGSAQAHAPVLTRALELGGLIEDLPGQQIRAVLKELVTRLPLPKDADRTFLLRMLIARERLGSTGLGEGIAIPHVRNPIVLRVSTPMVTLAFLRQPVDFHAVDGKPVSTLFTLITPTVRMHLTLLSRLAFVLQDTSVRQALSQRERFDSILGHCSRVEDQLKTAASPSGGQKRQA